MKKTKIQYQYTYTILYSLQLLIIGLSLLIVSMNVFSITENGTIKNSIEFFLSCIVIGSPFFTSLGLLIDFLVFKKRKHVLLVSIFILLLSLFFLFSFS